MDVRTEKSSLNYLKTLKISPKFWYEENAFECFQFFSKSIAWLGINYREKSGLK